MRNLDSNIPCETKLTALWYCASLLRHFVSLLNASLRKGLANRSATFFCTVDCIIYRVEFEVKVDRSYW